MTGALAGITCLDFSMGVAGPHAGMLCALHGADVVKVETLDGDWARALGTPHGDLSAYSAIYNRDKRSLALDLKDEEAREILRERAAKVDVIIEAFRPGVMKKFGLDYESVRARNPGVIYLSVTGFGPSGPMSGMPATDVVAQSFSGFMYMNRDRAGIPQRLGMVLIDVVTGLYGFQAIATALIDRTRNGGAGRQVDCSLLKAAMGLLASRYADDLLSSGEPVMYVPLGYFATRDGGLSISVMHDEHFVALCAALEDESFARDPRYATREARLQNEQEVVQFVRARFPSYSTDELSARLTARGVLHARVHDYQQVLQHPQVQTVSAVSWVHQDGIEPILPVVNVPGAPPASAGRGAPHIGEHSREILLEWGVGAARADGLIERKVVRA